MNIWLWPHVISGFPVPLTIRGCRASCDHCPQWFSAVSWPLGGSSNFLILRITASVVNLEVSGCPLVLTHAASPSKVFKSTSFYVLSFSFEISSVVSVPLTKHWLRIYLVTIKNNWTFPVCQDYPVISFNPHCNHFHFTDDKKGGLDRWLVWVHLVTKWQAKIKPRPPKSRTCTPSHLANWPS